MDDKFQPNSGIICLQHFVLSPKFGMIGLTSGNLHADAGCANHHPRESCTCAGWGSPKTTSNEQFGQGTPENTWGVLDMSSMFVAWVLVGTKQHGHP